MDGVNCETEKACQIICNNNEQFSSLDFPKLQFILGTSNVSITFRFLSSLLPEGTELAKLTKDFISSVPNIKVRKKQVCFLSLLRVSV